VERARGEVSLTYFEFTTLAILRLFAARTLDAAVLEIGLGGRLDAVNLIDADCFDRHFDRARPCRLSGDHARQRGVRKGARVPRRATGHLLGSVSAPSLLDYAQLIGAQLRVLGRDFEVVVFQGARATPEPRQQWTYRGPTLQRASLPMPALRGQHQLRNAAGALAALEALAERLPVSQQAVRQGLLQARIEGRVPGSCRADPVVILDVAHNPQAGEALARTRGEHECQGRTHAVFAMLRDKDAAGVAEQLKNRGRIAGTWPRRLVRGHGFAHAGRLRAVGPRAGWIASIRLPRLSPQRARPQDDDRILVCRIIRHRRRSRCVTCSAAARSQVACRGLEVGMKWAFWRRRAPR